MQLITAFRNWFEAPFRGTVSPSTLFWLLGMVIIAGMIWSRIIVHVVEPVLTEIAE